MVAYPHIVSLLEKDGLTKLVNGYDSIPIDRVIDETGGLYKENPLADLLARHPEKRHAYVEVTPRNGAYTAASLNEHLDHVEDTIKSNCETYENITKKPFKTMRPETVRFGHVHVNHPDRLRQSTWIRVYPDADYVNDLHKTSTFPNVHKRFATRNTLQEYRDRARHGERTKVLNKGRSKG